MGIMRVKDLRTGRIIETDNPYFQRVLFLQGSRYQTISDDEYEQEQDKPVTGQRKKTKKADESTPESEE